MKSKILLIAILVIGQSILANTKVWTLEECVNYALENNISILQARNNILSNEQDVISAKGNFMPGISSNISGSMSIGKVELYQGEFADREFYSSSLGIGFSQTIYLFVWFYDYYLFTTTYNINLLTIFNIYSKILI